MAKVTIYRNILDKQTYRTVDDGQLEYRCMLTGEWLPSSRDIHDVINQSVSEVIVVGSQDNSTCKKVENVTVLKMVGGWLARLFGGASHA